MWTRDDANAALKAQLIKEGKPDVDPETLSEWERFNVGMRRILAAGNGKGQPPK
jgi:hypothetical protein